MYGVTKSLTNDSTEIGDSVFSSFLTSPLCLTTTLPSSFSKEYPFSRASTKIVFLPTSVLAGICFVNSDFISFDSFSFSIVVLKVVNSVSFSTKFF